MYINDGHLKNIMEKILKIDVNYNTMHSDVYKDLNVTQFDIKIPETFNQIRVIPYDKKRIKIEIVYTVEETSFIETDKFMGIDLGINNFATCVTNVINQRPIIFNGKTIKSINQQYNKRSSFLKSKLRKKQYSSKQLHELAFRRKTRINNIFHLYSRRIIEYCIQNNISNIIIGRNKDWKQNCNMGKRNNQKFVSIPYYKFIQMLQYKAQLNGIKITLTEESYTSKADNLINAPLSKKGATGKRVHRGLYKSSNGKIINADVNGALGIIRKVISNCSLFISKIGDNGYLYYPKLCNISNLKENNIIFI